MSQVRGQDGKKGVRPGWGRPASLGFLGLAALSVAGAGFYFFLAYVPARRAETVKNLQEELDLRATSQKASLDQWFAAGLADAERLAGSPDQLVSLTRATATAATESSAVTSAQAGKLIERFMKMVTTNRIVVLDRGGSVMAEVGKKQAIVSTLLRTATTVQARGKSTVDFHRHGDGSIAVSFLAGVKEFVASQVTGKVGRAPAVVLVEVDPNAWLYPFLLMRPLAAVSAENVLLQREGDDIVFLSPLRAEPAAPLNFKRRAAVSGFAALAAVEGRTGFGEYVDYRGELVFASVVRLDSVSCGLVVKVDQREALAPYRQKIRHTGATAAKSMVGFWVVAFFLFRAWRRRAEKQLESEHSLLSAFINRPDDLIVFSLDSNYRYTAFNDKHRLEMKKVWNADIEVGASLLDCMRVPELRNRAKQSMDRALRGEGFWEEQHQPELDIYYEFSWNPVRLGEKIVGVAAFVRDITQRKREEVSLRENEARLRAVLDAAPFPVALVDIEGNHIEYWSRGAVELFGHTPPTASEWYELAYPDPGYRREVVERWKPLLLEARASGRTVNTGEYRVTCRDGSVRLCELYATLLPDRLVVTFNDITARKRAEAELAAMNAELERRVSERTAQLQVSNQELESFAYAVSHDLRAPLRGIDGWSQAVLEDYGPQLDERGRQYLATVRGETRRMAQLIDDLLVLSRVTRAPLARETVDLTALSLVTAANLRASEPGRVVEVVVAPGMSARGDAGLLGIALANLLGNAWKFTSKQPQARIEVGSAAELGQTVYHVRDNGVGFDMRYAGKLFAPFQRLHGSAEFPGTGIGLATVQRIIHRHGGEVRAVAEPGRGATFTFTLTE